MTKKVTTLYIVLFCSLVMTAVSAEIPEPVKKILKTKCANCHSMQVEFPWYADLPVARDVIQHDIEEGRQYFLMETEIFLKKDEHGLTLTEIPEVTLNRLESVIEDGSMPPFKYLVMHWDHALTPEDKKNLLDWIHELRGEKMLRPLPDPKKIGLSWDKINLGRELFHDTRLSRDNSISCASCHDLTKGGTDQAQFSTGINGNKGHMNSPTVFNSSYNFKQFWDGRADDLFAQASGPVHNPIEMGSNWEEVIKKLKKDDDLEDLFEKAYGTDDISGELIADAIATFEKSLLTPNRFDRFLEGDEAALTAEERKGYELFLKYDCSTCHTGPSLGGQSFEKMGLERDYFEDRALGDNGLTQMPLAMEDYGRYNVTKKEIDRHYFKVPNLRNVEKTFPYMHDGNVETLEEAVRIMGEYQLHKKLPQRDVELIVKFLKSLTAV